MQCVRLTKNVLATTAVLISLISILTFPAYASDYDRWGAHNPEESTSVDHTPMSNILKFLTVDDRKKTQMAYYRATGKGLEYITNYRKYLEGIPVSLLNKDEQLAYWLNLHNVAVIEMLSNNNKWAKKIKKLRRQPGKPGEEWAKKRLSVEKISLSLEEIEQQILVRQWKNPLVMYGIFYSTKGSVFLGKEGFSGKTVFQQLSSIATTFISNKRNVKVKKDKVQVSSLYAWNKLALFAGDDNVLIAHLQKYAKGKLASEMQKVTSIDDSHQFNWSTTAQSRPRKISGVNAGSGGSGYGTGS